MIKALPTIPVLFIFCALMACKGPKDSEMKERVKKLGIEIFHFVQKGDYEASLPQDLVYMGNNTFWRILEIPEPLDYMEFVVQDAKGVDDEVDYLMDIGDHIGLRITYDEGLDKFHLLGYQGVSEKKGGSALQQTIFELEQELYSFGYIKPGVGLGGFEIDQSNRKELFKKYNERLLNKLGVWLGFQNDTLRCLYFSRYQQQTEKGIRPETSTKTDILTHYGKPNKTRSNFTFLDKEMDNVNVLEYDGVEFVLLKDQLMLIKVKQVQTDTLYDVNR